MKFLIALVVVFLNISFSFAQANLSEVENQIKNEFDTLLVANSDSLKWVICKRIEQAFQKVLTNKESFDYPFATLNKMGKLTSPDSRFRIYNWNCVLNDGGYQYFCLIQKKEKGKLVVRTAKDSKPLTSMEAIHKSDDWAGALYYQIIPFQSKNETSYMFLGWDGNNYVTNKKVIEILSFDDEGKAQFGMPIILWRGKLLSRVIFEYAKQVRMSLQYSVELRKIVFDHLSPSSLVYKNQFEYYGPDFSYDALEYRDGKWMLVENIDVRNK